MEKKSLWESLLKPFLSNKEKIENPSSQVQKTLEMQDLEDNIPVGFFDSSTSYYATINTSKQKSLIENYREISTRPEVAEAINEIVDEAIFNPFGDLISIDFHKDVSDELKKAINEELDTICDRINIRKNIYSLFKNFYVDGQLNLHCSYNNDNLKEGIKNISVISPIGLHFDKDNEVWEYDKNANLSNKDNMYGINGKTSSFFRKEEIIRVDSGIYSNNLIYSNLHSALKPSNMLSSLEDMLVPIRFSRSVSRRVFNVDVSNLSPKKAEEIMRKNQQRFKYKKFYDTSSGTISNEQHITALTEDYWFANRNNGKGTTVDTIDETGNLGELDDIIYMQKKLYSSLNIPTERIERNSEYDFDTTSITREELKFFNFISRLRNQFLDIFLELIKRQLISKGLITEEEFTQLFIKSRIKFNSENSFFEKMQREKISMSLDLYGEIEDLIGKYFSQNYVFKKILKLNDREIDDMIKEIEQEKKSSKFKHLYEEE